MLRDLVERHQARYLDLKLVDLHGRPRHVTLPVEAVDASVLEAGVGFDGSSYGFKKVQASDMVMVPDPETAFLDPFRDVPTVSMLASAHRAEDGLPRAPEDSRGVLARAVERLRALNIADELLVAPEYEYYVFDDLEVETGVLAAGFRIDASCGRSPKAYNEVNPADRYLAFRDEAVRMLVDLGMPVRYHHHEVGGYGQQEIEAALAPVSAAGDHAILVRYVLSNLADRYGLKVTFMPKPLYEQAGSGWHVHMMLRKGEQNLFHDKRGPSGLSPVALSWIGGILSHGPALAAFTNASTNSYKRLTPGFEAPVALTFGPADRTAAMRIPRWARGEDTRVEYRPGDFTGNPYLVLAGLIMAGVDGVERGIDPVAEGFGPAETLAPEQVRMLPPSLWSACDALARDREFLERDGVFAPELVDRWLTTKRAEASDVVRRPHPREFELYFEP